MKMLSKNPGSSARVPCGSLKQVAVTPQRRSAAVQVAQCRWICHSSSGLALMPEATRLKQTAPVDISMDFDSLLENSLDCPHGFVGSVMSENGPHLKATPEETLENVIPKLASVVGVPVVGPSGKVEGLISRKDIIEVRNGGGSLQQLVRANMTSPAVTVRNTATVREAADLMLLHKLRFLPVINDAEIPLGVVSRTDIFKPLFEESLQSYLRIEQEAVRDGTGLSVSLASRPDWVIKYLFDGSCSMCRGLVAVLKRNDHDKLINFVDIQDPSFCAKNNMGVEKEEAMKTVYAVYPNGVIVRGTDALHVLFDIVGLGWATRLSELPIISQFVEWLYQFLSANRMSLGNAFDAVIASKRVAESKEGVETCGDVEDGCVIEW